MRAKVTYAKREGPALRVGIQFGTGGRLASASCDRRLPPHIGETVSVEKTPEGPLEYRVIASMPLAMAS